MFRQTTLDARQIALSTVAALLLSATCVLGAVGPARAAELPVAVTPAR